MSSTAALPTAPLAATANDRLKRSFEPWFWRSLGAATLLHFLLLALWPSMALDDLSIQTEALEQIEVMAEVQIPPPPERIVRPAVPVLSLDMELADDITIAPGTFDANPVAELPPPPSGQADFSQNPVFVPRDVEPVLRNRDEFAAVLQRRYPPMLRDAGIGGTVVLWVWVEESGAVGQTRVISSSGNDTLDQLAQDVMRESARYSPALNRDRKVAVWVQMPVTFRTQR